MEDFVKNCNISSWILLAGFILNFQIQSMSFTLLLATLYVFSQTATLFNEPKSIRYQKIWWILSIILGFIVTICLGTAIGLNTLSGRGGGIMMHKDLFVFYIGVGFIFPIVYFLLIRTVMQINTYRKRGIFLMSWFGIMIWIFVSAASDSPKEDDFSTEYPNIPFMNIMVPVIIFLYALRLFEIDPKE